jgi:antibiotic biosynthesis monooxygenase (ABM) superfamily enzyme
MDKSRDGKHSSKEFTEVINRNIKVGHEKDYDEWLRRYMKLESEVPGYLGTTIIAPGGSSSSERYVINRFADKSSLDSWESSEVARKLIAEANTCSTYERATGLETWFALPNLKTIAAPP